MFQRRSRPRLLPLRYLALGCSLLLYQRYYLICPSRRGKTSDSVFQPRKQVWEGEVPLKFTQLGTGSISPRAQGSVAKLRAPSRSPIHLQGHRHGLVMLSEP